MTRFVVVGFGRSGTTYLCHLLRNHSDIEFHRGTSDFCEAFPEGFVPDGQTVEERLQCCLYFDTKAHAIGTKILYEQLRGPTGYSEIKRPKVIEPWLVANGVQIIEIERCNALRRLVSRKAAIASDQWINQTKIRSRMQVIHISAEDLRAELKLVPLLLPMGLLTDVPRLVVSYEDLCQDTAVVFEKLCDFLDVSRQAPGPVNLQKQQVYPLQQVIENFDALQAKFAGTPHEWMFNR